MTIQMTDAQTSAHNTALILDDLETIAKTLPTFTKSDLFTLGTRLTTLLADAREAYKVAVDACKGCGQFPEYCECQSSQPAPVAAPVEQTGYKAIEIIDGTYTVELSAGGHRTIKIKTQAPDASFMPGKRIASYLNGPDNWANYKGFAFVNDDGTFNVWRKHQGAGNLIMALAQILNGKEAMLEGLKGYAMMSGNCGICHKKLTTPESIKRGIGPECAAKLGL